MAQKSSIEWTNSTWNPLTGCNQVSPGCAHCYAKALSKRLKAMGNARYTNGFDLTLHDDLIDLPLKWKTPRMIFVNSMSDLFHEEVPIDFIQRVFLTMNKAPHHIFQVLTKRHERLAEIAEAGLVRWTPNIWQGVSIENYRFAHRADYLRKVPVDVRFLSCEPLLGSLDRLDLTGIHWVIAGGESGYSYRPVSLENLRVIRDKCRAAGVPFFLKQIGGLRPTSGGKLLDGVAWQQMPATQYHAARLYADR
jgi:protein gp37